MMPSDTTSPPPPNPQHHWVSYEVSVVSIVDAMVQLDKVDQEDIKWVIKELEVPIKASYLDLLLSPLDKKGNGMIQ